jgi:phenylacetate-CoA ligase
MPVDAPRQAPLERLTAVVGEWFYRSMPAVRPLLATLKGSQLRYRRYGRRTKAIVEEALDREQWPADKLRKWQEAKVSEILHHAVRNVPYYREYWQQRRRKGDDSSWEILENWPILEKDAIRNNPWGFVAENYRSGRLYHEITSGTTGSPISLWFDRSAVQKWYGLAEARWRGWNGLSRHDRWAMLGAQFVVPIEQQRPPYWVWNAAMHQLYCSAYHLSQNALRAYLEAIAAYRVRYVWGHTSALCALAMEARRLDWKYPMAAVMSSSEPLSAQQRRTIREAFGCPAVETYGMTEMAAAASECGEGNLHEWPEAAYLELVPDEGSAASDRPAHVISTVLLNPAMPLIRYRTGDMAAPRLENGACPCGRSLPLFGPVLGRFSDVLYTSDARAVTPSAVESIFDGEIGIREGQIIQEALGSIRILYVPAETYGERDARNLIERVRQRLGDVAVTLERVEYIPRGPNGKFRAVVCKVCGPVAGGRS